jgi:hypothetical protein
MLASRRTLDGGDAPSGRDPVGLEQWRARTRLYFD